MDELQNKMNSILSNPEMMQQIMAMAQSLGQSMPQESAPQQESPPPALPDIDLSMIQKLSGFVGKSSIDNNQRTLLKALTPYLSQERIIKLEKAMRAAKLANIASSFLGQSGLSFLTGR